MRRFLILYVLISGCVEYSAPAADGGIAVDAPACLCPQGTSFEGYLVDTQGTHCVCSTPGLRR